MLQYLPPILTANVGWSNYSGEYADMNNSINAMFEGLPNKVRHTASRDERMTINTPHSSLLFKMQQYENPTTTRQLQIRYTTAKLDTDNSLSDFVNRTFNILGEAENILAFRHVTAGTTRISDYNPGDIELKAVSLALQRSNQHRIRVVKRGTVVQIITNVYNWELYYKALALLPAFFPETYPNRSTEVMNMLKALRELNNESFLENFNIWENRNNLEGARTVRVLQNLLTSVHAEKQMLLENTINSTQRDIDNWFEQIRTSHITRTNAQAMLRGLADPESLKEAMEELGGYLKSNKSILGFGAGTNNGAQLTLQIATPIQYFDEDALKSIYFKTQYDPKTAPMFQRMLYNTLLTGKYQLYTASSVHLSIRDSSAHADTGYSHPVYWKHPHLTQHNCWGNNKTLVVKALQASDFIGAAEQCVAANMNLNVLDTTVMNSLSRQIGDYAEKKTFLNTETQEFVTLHEMLKAERTSYETPDITADTI